MSGGRCVVEIGELVVHGAGRADARALAAAVREEIARAARDVAGVPAAGRLDVVRVHDPALRRTPLRGAPPGTDDVARAVARAVTRVLQGGAGGHDG